MFERIVNMTIRFFVGAWVVRYLYCPTEVDLLLGDAEKAREQLGWTSQHSLEEMVQRDIKEANEEMVVQRDS